MDIKQEILIHDLEYKVSRCHLEFETKSDNKDQLFLNVSSKVNEVKASSSIPLFKVGDISSPIIASANEECSSSSKQTYEESVKKNGNQLDWRTLKSAKKIPKNLVFKKFSSIRYLCDGSHSNIYTALWNDRSIIIKIVKDEMKDLTIIKNEFKMEIEILSRLRHPNIIRILGHGNQKGRIFIVIEPVDEVGPNFNTIRRWISKPALFLRSLNLGLQLASAISYLHNEIHPKIMILHRDIKLENIGLGNNGEVRLFDFGLCRILLSRQNETDTYVMSGATGTLRYMAPEVFLNQPYNDKVDVYSFTLILWQILTRQMPFLTYTRTIHVTNVINGGERPGIPPDWPMWLSDMLSAGWHANHIARPSMSQIYETMRVNIASMNQNSNKTTTAFSYERWLFCCATSKSKKDLEYNFNDDVDEDQT